VSSKFRATTLLDLYRDNTGLPASGSFDGYDDDALSTEPLHEALPADVTNITTKASDPVTGRTSIVEKWRARLRPGADVQVADRILDLRTGHWFTVDAAVAPVGATGAADVRLELTRIAG
jgi:hypothetical protein